MEMYTVMVQGRQIKTYFPDLLINAYKTLGIDAYQLPRFLQEQAL